MELQVLGQVRKLQQQAASLLVYQGVLETPPGSAYLHLLNELVDGDEFKILRAYGAWFRALAEQQQSWQHHLMEQILLSNNPFSEQAQGRSLQDLPVGLQQAAATDLHRLQQIARSGEPQISQWVKTAAGLEASPVVWEVNAAPPDREIETHFQSSADWATLLPELANHYRQAGTGLFSRYRAFRWQNGTLAGVAHPDPIRLDALVGYEMQRDALVQNTQALLSGYPALHVLLYGSRGTGKSSLVKGLLNEASAVSERLQAHHLLRLVEVSKADLTDLPLIVDRLRVAPQKFIIFVDDLSFEEDDDAFKALKVVLEGNVIARPQNVVVYATSNRRHLVREYFGDRPRPRDADEVHSWDSVQEKLSFSDRFGLTLTFEPANQDTYLAIVHHLAAQSGITLDTADLEYRALQWATRHNGRSGRTARQFVDFLQAELKQPGRNPVL